MWISKKRFKELEESLKSAHNEIYQLREKTTSIMIPFDNLDNEYSRDIGGGINQFLNGKYYSMNDILTKLVAHLGITHVERTTIPSTLKIKRRR